MDQKSKHHLLLELTSHTLLSLFYHYSIIILFVTINYLLYIYAYCNAFSSSLSSVFYVSLLLSSVIHLWHHSYPPRLTGLTSRSSFSPFSTIFLAFIPILDQRILSYALFSSLQAPTYHNHEIMLSYSSRRHRGLCSVHTRLPDLMYTNPCRLSSFLKGYIH